MVAPAVAASCSLAAPVCASAGTGIFGAFTAFITSIVAFIKKKQIFKIIHKLSFIQLFIVFVVICLLVVAVINHNKRKDSSDEE